MSIQSRITDYDWMSPNILVQRMFPRVFDWLVSSISIKSRALWIIWRSKIWYHRKIVPIQCVIPYLLRKIPENPQVTYLSSAILCAATIGGGEHSVTPKALSSRRTYWSITLFCRPRLAFWNLKLLCNRCPQTPFSTACSNPTNLGYRLCCEVTPILVVGICLLLKVPISATGRGK